MGSGGVLEVDHLQVGPCVGEFQTEVVGRFAGDEVVEEVDGAHRMAFRGARYRAWFL